MKHHSRKTVEFGLTEALSTDIPDKPKFRLSKKFAILAASALFCWAAFGLSQSAKAEDGFTVAGVNSTLPAWSRAAKSEQPSQPDRQIAGDSAFSALTSFAQEIGAEAPKSQSSARQIDDHAFSELQAFAQRVGAGQLESIKGQPQLAEANSLLEWLAAPKQELVPAPKGPAPGGNKTGAPVDAHFVGDKACLTCHSSQTAEFKKTLMGRISMTQPGKFACENCHGPGSAHVKAGGGRGVGGIMGFGETDPRTTEEKNSVCLACHEKGDRTYWNGSTHETRGLTCTNCHTVMKDVSRKHNVKTAFEPDTCFQCHKDRRAQMYRSSHMPLREGKITCTDCHNPHGSATEALLKQNSINDNCYTCHAEKRGPFLWEHAPVRENCLNCHDAHGSTKEYMLKIQRPKLCAECHGFDHGTGLLNNQNQRYIFNKGCGNCHVKIHGSNHPSGAYFER